MKHRTRSGRGSVLAMGIATGIVVLASAATLASAGGVDPESECGIFDEWVAEGDDEWGLAFIHAATGTTNARPSTHDSQIKNTSSDRRGEVHNTWSEGSYVEHPFAGCNSEADPGG